MYHFFFTWTLQLVQNELKYTYLVSIGWSISRTFDHPLFFDMGKIDIRKSIIILISFSSWEGKNMEHSFNIYLAELVGIHQAIFLKNIHFWIEKNKANMSNFHEGKHWTFNSVRAYSLLFPYFTDKQIRTVTEKLEFSELIITGRFNKVNYDKTKWYTLTDKYYELYTKCLEKESKSLCPQGQMDMTIKANPLDHEGKSIRPEGQTYTIYKPDKNKDKNEKAIEAWDSLITNIKNRDREFTRLEIEICKVGCGSISEIAKSNDFKLSVYKTSFIKGFDLVASK